MYLSIFKFVFDFLVSLLGLILLSPLFCLITVALFFANNKKPFFFQKRPGKNEKIFEVIKFKTMNDKRDSEGELLPDCDRLTRLGSFIRKTSLDELPQLMNVIKGDMSLVGPRPLLVEYLGLYDKNQKKRHNVRPGITGWAQVNGRNTISWEDKFKLDVYYVERISLMFDLLIIYKTISKVFMSHGITAPGVSTMNKFEGS
jgi:lipopolysaccharide/colanic/teichoic acid biosynthesis glycosyltransferase